MNERKEEREEKKKKKQRINGVSPNRPDTRLSMRQTHARI